jgi:hypothetical protein
MSERVSAKFEIAAWDEEQFDETEGLAKLSGAAVQRTYTGDIEGTSTTRWLMAYAPDETASFVGLERIKGTVAGKKGSLVLRHVGAFENGAATATLTVLSGTDELSSVSGDGDFTADPAGSVELNLTFG